MGCSDKFKVGGGRKKKTDPNLTTNYWLKELAEWWGHLQRCKALTR